MAFTTLFLLCLTTSPLFSQGYNSVLSKKALEEDLQLLKHNLEVVQPALYTYTPKEEMDAAFAEIKARITNDMTDIDFYRLLAPLQQKIKNGHTMIIPSTNWDDYKNTTAKFFPFEVHWYDNRLFVLKNLSKQETIPLGAEIKSINGLPALMVFNTLLNNVTSDGDNETFPSRLITLGFSDWYADVIGVPNTFDIQFLFPDGISKILKIEALGAEALNQTHLQRYKTKRLPWYIQEDENLLELSIKDKVAILTVPTFDSSSKGIDGKKYKQFHKAAFRQIKAAGVEHLILDLRDNGGGDPKPQVALLSHLINKPLSLYRRAYAITNKVPNPKLYKDDNIRMLNFLAKLALKKRDTIYEETGNFFARLSGSVTGKVIPPAKDVYEGKLYTLMDGGSFSATGEALGQLKNANRGVFIGEEAGGNPVQNTSGRMPMLTLPNSGVRLRLALLSFENNIELENTRHGVLPDYQVAPSVFDLLEKRDVVLAKTMELIGN